MTARQILERRLGRDLGPLATMARDLRDALYYLALELASKGKRRRRPIRAIKRKGYLPA